MKAGTIGGRELTWLRGVLWPDERLTRVSPDHTPPEGFRRYQTYAVIPSAARPRLLVPAARGVSRTGFMQFNNSMSQRARLTKALAGVLFDLGPGRRLIRDHIHVDVVTDLEPARRGDALLEHHISEVLSQPQLMMSVTFGSLRPNRKPVLQMTDPRGEVVAYAKVAWNDLTTSLVDEEADALRRWAADPPRSFRVPELLHHGAWHDRALIVTSGFRSPVWRRGRVNAPPPVRVLREVAERGGLSFASICAAPLWTELRTRGAMLADPDARDRLAELIDRFERRFAGVETAIGSWHGDWAPWNMSWVDGRLAIWDWERARSGVPVGLDAIHFAFQVAFRTCGRRPAEAKVRTLPLAAPTLVELSVARPAHEALLTMYLFELFHRYEDATTQGVLSADDPIRAGILGTLAEALEVHPR